MPFLAGKDESQKRTGCLKMAASLPPWSDPRSWETSVLSHGLGSKSLLRSKLASDLDIRCSLNIGALLSPSWEITSSFFSLMKPCGRRV